MALHRSPPARARAAPWASRDPIIGRVNLVMDAIPIFILLMGVEYAYGRWRGRNTYRLADTVNSLSLGTLSRLSGLVSLGLAGGVVARLRPDAGFAALAGDGWAAWAAAFVGYDLCYYWAHRFGHQWRLFWASHIAHHQSEQFNLSTALRQAGTGTTFMFYLPLYLLGFPPVTIVTVGASNLIYQFWVHTEHVGRLGVLEWLLVTPSNHRVHHARNPCYVDRNYGGVFIVWDRLFGTFEPERDHEPCVYGITHPLASWNPLWANLHVWLETLRGSLRTRRLRDKLALWFTSPAWHPDDLPAPPGDWRHARFDPPMVPGCGALAFAQYWLVTAASLGLLVQAPGLPQGFVLTAAVLLASSFYVIGTFLEGRRYAAALELGRLALTCGVVALWHPTLGSTLTVLVLCYVGVSALGLVWLFSLRPRLAAARTSLGIS